MVSIGVDYGKYYTFKDGGSWLSKFLPDDYDFTANIPLAKNGRFPVIADRINDDGMRQIQVAKNGRMNTLEKPKEHKMIKHSSPLAQNEHGLFQHNLYSAVQHIGFGIKSYV